MNTATKAVVILNAFRDRNLMSPAILKQFQGDE